MTWATILTQILHSILRDICFSLDLFVDVGLLYGTKSITN